MFTFDNSKGRTISQGQVGLFLSRGVPMHSQTKGRCRKCGKDYGFQISTAAFAWTTFHHVVVEFQFLIHRAITQSFPTAKSLGDIMTKQHSVYNLVLKTVTWNKTVIQPCYLKLHWPNFPTKSWIGDLQRTTEMQETLNQGEARFRWALNKCPTMVGSACHIMLALLLWAEK